MIYYWSVRNNISQVTSKYLSLNLQNLFLFNSKHQKISYLLLSQSNLIQRIYRNRDFRAGTTYRSGRDRSFQRTPLASLDRKLNCKPTRAKVWEFFLGMSTNGGINFDPLKVTWSLQVGGHSRSSDQYLSHILNRIDFCKTEFLSWWVKMSNLALEFSLQLVKSGRKMENHHSTKYLHITYILYIILR